MKRNVNKILEKINNFEFLIIFSLLNFEYRNIRKNISEISKYFTFDLNEINLSEQKEENGLCGQ